MSIKKTASNANMWTECEGFIHAANDFVAKYGKLPAPNADEGRFAHSLADMALRELVDSGGSAFGIPDELNGQVVPAEMKIKIRDYVSYCADIIDSVFAPIIWIEQRFNCDFLEKGNHTRVDFALYDPAREHLFVVDLKYGHRQVLAYENPQLLIGAQSIIDFLKNDNKSVDEVTMIIYQPNGPSSYSPVGEWRQTAGSVLLYSGAIKGWYDSGGTELTPGGHCHYCPARGACDAVVLALYESWDVMAAYNHICPDFSAAELENMIAEVGRIKELLRAHETGLEAMIVSKINKGCDFPLWEYSASLSDRKWAFPEQDIAALARSMGVDIEKKSILSPKQAEMAGMPKEVVASLVKRESTGKKLRKKSLKTLQMAFG